jgi:hypothetical protein
MALGFLGNIIGDVASSLYDNIPEDISNLYTTDIPDVTAPDIGFKGFTVTGPTGQIRTTKAGGTKYTLDPTSEAIQSALETQALSRFGATPAGAGQLGAAGQQLLGMGQQQLGVSPFGLAGQQQAAQSAFGLGEQFMGQAGMPMGAREQEVYDRIRATQLGEEERQRLALEERLFAQGRGGVQTAMFGGTPEQLALAKAQESAQNQAALMAITQAQQEQRQAADIGATYGQLGSNIATQRQALEAAQQAMATGAMQGGMGLMTGGLGLEQLQQQLGLSALQGAYLPQAAMLSAFSPALNVASLADVARRQGGQYEMETDIANLEAELQRQAGLSNLYSGLFSGATGLVGGLGTGLSNILGDTGMFTDIYNWAKGFLPSDIALKTNVQLQGQLPNGINLYTWDWTEEGKELSNNAPSYGVIAQEVQEIMPEAVVRGDHGYLTVDYSKLI